MGSLGCGDDEFNPLDDNSNLEVEDIETLDYDSKFPVFQGESDDEIADVPGFLDTTVPYNDTVLNNYSFETQLLNFDGETQMMNVDGGTVAREIGGGAEFVDLGDDTQMMNTDGEIQVYNDYNCIQDLDTELLDEFNDEANSSDGDTTDTTEILSDEEGLMVILPSSKSGDQTLGNEDVGSMAKCQVKEGSTIRTVPSTDIPCRSGPMQRGFVHIRTASLRSLGLAARSGSMGSKAAEECNKRWESQSSELPASIPSSLTDVDAADWQLDVEANSEKLSSIGYENRSRVCSKAVRKLFMDEVDAVDEEPKDNFHDDKALLSQFNGTTELAGLSYVNSQEPGELSEASALEVVDKFLKVNVFDLDLHTSIGMAAVEKQNYLLRTKGPQHLAKKAEHRSIIAESKVYDWDDSREDEGGGEFFCKKKDVLLGVSCRGQKSSAVASKRKNYTMKVKKPPAKSRNEDPNIQSKLTRSIPSDEQVALQNISVLEQLNEMGTKTVVCIGLDERNAGSHSGSVEAAKAHNHMIDVGFDTQMAAEAMGELANGLHSADHGCQNGDVILRKRARKTAVSKKGVQKRVHPLSPEVITGSPTSHLKPMKVPNSHVAMTTRSKNARKGDNIDCHKLKAKRCKASSENFSRKGKQMLDQMEPKIADKWKEDISETSPDNQSCLQANAPAVGGKLRTFSPVAWRTRQSTQVTKFNDICDTTNHSEEARQKSRVNSIRSGEHLKYVVDQAIKNDRKRKLFEVEKCITRRKRSRNNARKPIPSRLEVNGGGRTGLIGLSPSVVSPRKNDLSSLMSPEQSSLCSRPAISAGDVHKSPNAAFTLPVECPSPVNEASPVCKGDEYYKRSCKKNLSRTSLIKELNRLAPALPRCTSTNKDSRKRRDMSSVRALFSRHLDEDVTKQQKKILVRLGASLASSISEATHFIANNFVRTRNMLEAIASGKPVVTDLWLESCAQTSCFIDEKNYILRDAKKEKEIGFSMPVTLLRAIQYPLLKEKRVLITPSAKPGIEIIRSLVGAVHGQAITKISRSLWKDDKLRDELLVLSCEDDYEICLSLLEKGVAVYSSELLLNGIVTQRLEYGRHRLFVDHVKRTRSTV